MRFLPAPREPNPWRRLQLVPKERRLLVVFQFDGARQFLFQRFRLAPRTAPVDLRQQFLIDSSSGGGGTGEPSSFVGS